MTDDFSFGLMDQEELLRREREVLQRIERTHVAIAREKELIAALRREALMRDVRQTLPYRLFRVCEEAWDGRKKTRAKAAAQRKHEARLGIAWRARKKHDALVLQ